MTSNNAGPESNGIYPCTRACIRVYVYVYMCNPPPPFRREKPNVPAQCSGEPFFQQKRFLVPRISVPGRKHTFFLVVL